MHTHTYFVHTHTHILCAHLLVWASFKEYIQVPTQHTCAHLPSGLTKSGMCRPVLTPVHTHTPTHTHPPLVSSHQGEISSPNQVTLLCVLGLAAVTGDPKDCSHCPSVPQLLPLPPNPPWPWPMPARDTRHGCLLSYVYVCLPNLFVTPWRVETVSCSLSPQNLA